jgi:hypothetical protein
LIEKCPKDRKWEEENENPEQDLGVIHQLGVVLLLGRLQPVLSVVGRSELLLQRKLEEREIQEASF